MTKKIINFQHIAGMVFGVPHYVTQQSFDAVKSVLLPRIINGTGTDPTITMAFSPDDSQSPENLKPSNQIAVIAIHGLIVPRRGEITNTCTELTSYEIIRSQLHTALNDESVSEIILDINSGGGFSQGCKELADYIYESKKIKPITAIVNFNAFSAAYFIAAACSKIIVSPTSGVGSIGVKMEHLDTSKLEENIGVKFTSLYRGDNKNSNTQHEPLSKNALEMINKHLDDAYEIFTSSVAEYRGIKLQDVIDTQASVYFGQDAISIGLADEISDPQTAINTIAAKYKQPPTQKNTSITLQAAVMDMQTRI